jgi:hypothetical protein
MVFGEMGTASERYAKTGERETRTFSTLERRMLCVCLLSFRSLLPDLQRISPFRRTIVASELDLGRRAALTLDQTEGKACPHTPSEMKHLISS